MADFVKEILDSTGPGVAMFSKGYCPYCKAAKKALHSIGINPVVVELDHRDDGREIQVALLQMTGQRTVPNVWLAGKFIGGRDETMEGVKNGIFKDVDTTTATVYAEYAGIETCSEADGAPCLCHGP